MKQLGVLQNKNLNQCGKNLAINLMIIAVLTAGAIIVLVNRKQYLTFETVSRPDVSICLEGGETLRQQYMSEREHIVQVTFPLDSSQKISGTYTLNISGTKNSSCTICTNIYNNDTVNGLVFDLPEEMNPPLGEQLYFSITASEDADPVLLSADSTLATCLRDHADTGSTLLISLRYYKNSTFYIVYAILFLTFGLLYLVRETFALPFAVAAGFSAISGALLTYLCCAAGVLQIAPALLFLLAFCGFALVFVRALQKKEIAHLEARQSALFAIMIIFMLGFTSRLSVILPGGDDIFFINQAHNLYINHEVLPGYESVLLSVHSYIYEWINGMFSVNVIKASYGILDVSCLFWLTQIPEKSVNSSRRIRLLQGFLILIVFFLLLLSILPREINLTVVDIPFTALLLWICGIYFLYFGRNRSFCLALGLAAAIITKTLGSILALILILFVMVDLCRDWHEDKGNVIRDTRLLLMLVVSAFAATVLKAYVSGNIAEQGQTLSRLAPSENMAKPYQGLLLTASPKMYGTSFAGILEAVRSLFRGDPPDSFVSIMHDIFSAAIELPVAYGISDLGIICVTLGGTIIYYFLVEKREETVILKNVLKLELGAVIWVTALSYKYLFAIEEENRYSINSAGSSFDRYSLPYMFMMLVLTGIFLYQDASRRIRLKNGNYKALEQAALLVFVTFLLVYKGNLASAFNVVDSTYSLIEDMRDPMTRKNHALLSEDSSLYVIAPSETIPDKTSWYLNAELQTWNYPARVVYPFREPTKVYLNNDYSTYDYVLLVNYDKEFLEGCSDLFENGISDVHRRAYYKVITKKDGSCKLHYIGDAPISGDMLLSLDGSVPINGVTNPELEDPSPEEYISSLDTQTANGEDS